MLRHLYKRFILMVYKCIYMTRVMNLEGMKEKYGLKTVCIQSGAQLCGHAKRLFAKNPGELQRERSQESGLIKPSPVITN